MFYLVLSSFIFCTDLRGPSFLFLFLFKGNISFVDVKKKFIGFYSFQNDSASCNLVLLPVG